MSKERRYSEGLGNDARAVIASIAARKGDKFQTSRLRAEADTEESVQWREARKNEESGLWRVREYRIRPDYLRRDEQGGLKQGGAMEQNTVLAEACFFDALYACAAFEAGAHMKPTADALKSPHFKAFAEAEGIVFDARDNMPVPVANGEILRDDCILDENALDIAERAQGNIVKPGPLKVENIVGAAASLPALVSATPLVSVSDMMRDIDHSLSTANVEAARKDAIEGLKNSYAFAAVNKFGRTGVRKIEKTGGDAGAIQTLKAGATCGGALLAAAALFPPLALPAFIFGGLMAGAAGAIFVAGSCMHGPVTFAGLIAKNGRRNVERAFQRDMRNVRKEIADLPSEQMQAEAKAAADHIEFGYRILSMRHAFKRASEAGVITRPFARHALKGEFAKLVEKAKEFGIEESSLAVIVESIRNKDAAAGLEQHAQQSITDQLCRLNEIFTEARGNVRLLAAPQGTEDAKKAAPLLRRAISLMPPQP